MTFSRRFFHILCSGFMSSRSFSFISLSFSLLSLYFYLTLICVCNFFFLFPENYILIRFIVASLFQSFIYMFGCIFFSRFRSLSLSSSISLFILFRTLTSFLFFFSPRTEFPLRYLSYRFFSRYIVKCTLLSCLYDTSVYFERVVITPVTIASLHCPY